MSENVWKLQQATPIGQNVCCLTKWVHGHLQKIPRQFLQRSMATATTPKTVQVSLAAKKSCLGLNSNPVWKVETSEDSCCIGWCMKSYRKSKVQTMIDSKQLVLCEKASEFQNTIEHWPPVGLESTCNLRVSMANRWDLLLAYPADLKTFVFSIAQNSKIT